jgi:hypothetical protein
MLGDHLYTCWRCEHDADVQQLRDAQAAQARILGAFSEFTVPPVNSSKKLYFNTNYTPVITAAAAAVPAEAPAAFGSFMLNTGSSSSATTQDSKHRQHHDQQQRSTRQHSREIRQGSEASI